MSINMQNIPNMIQQNNQNSHNNNNIPNLVTNIEQNVDTYGNINNQNYIPIQTNYNKDQQNLTYNPNFIPQQNTNHMFGGNKFNTQQDNHPIVNSINSIETIENTDKKKGYMIFLKSVIIYTILFVIFSHNKTTSFVDNYIPFSQQSNFILIITKGLMMSLIIIFLNKMLKL